MEKAFDAGESLGDNYEVPMWITGEDVRSAEFRKYGDVFWPEWVMKKKNVSYEAKKLVDEQAFPSEDTGRGVGLRASLHERCLLRRQRHHQQQGVLR